MKIRHPNTLLGQFVQVRRFQHRVAVYSNVPVAHIVSDDQDDVGFSVGT